MKPAPFAYHAPTTLEQAVSLAAELGDEARALAGGQSLVPLMNLRLAQPTALIDLARVEGLDRIERNGGLRVGCMVSHTTVQRSSEARASVPMLPAAIGYLGHPAIRNRGTVGGSLAHADPSAEEPLVAVALDAELVLTSRRGQRTVAATDFFQGPFMTALEDDELLTQAVFPLAAADQGWGFREMARAHGDFALVSAAAVVSLDGDRAKDVRIAVGGAADRPIRVHEAEASLEGERPTGEAVQAAARLVQETVSPSGDSHATSGYRKDVAGVLTARALDDALQRAHREA